MSSAKSKNFEKNIRKYIELHDDQILSVPLNNVVFLITTEKYEWSTKLLQKQIKNIKKKASQVNGTKSHAEYWYFNREVHNKAHEALSCN